MKNIQLWINGRASQEYSPQEVRAMLDRGNIHRETLMLEVGDKEWSPVGDHAWRWPQQSVAAAAKGGNKPKEVTTQTADSNAGSGGGAGGIRALIVMAVCVLASVLVWTRYDAKREREIRFEEYTRLKAFGQRLYSPLREPGQEALIDLAEWQQGMSFLRRDLDSMQTSSAVTKAAVAKVRSKLDYIEGRVKQLWAEPASQQNSDEMYKVVHSIEQTCQEAAAMLQQF